MARRGSQDFSDMDFPRLANLRMGQLELDQTDLAEMIGVTQGTVSRWMNYTRRPRPEYHEAIATALQVPRATVANAVSITEISSGPRSGEQLAAVIAERDELLKENERLRSLLDRARVRGFRDDR